MRAIAGKIFRATFGRPDKPPIVPSPSPAPVKNDGLLHITSFEDLDAIIDKAERAAYQVSDDERRRILASFRFELPVQHSLDPWSDDNRNEQLAIY